MSEVASLETILNQILGRIESIEKKIDVGSVPSSDTGGSSSVDEIADSSAVVGYDKHVLTALQSFVAVVESIPGLAESSLVDDLKTCWAAIRSIVKAASRCKKPPSLPTALAPYLKPAQESVGRIQKLRLSRDFDNHLKAVTEMTSCLGWVMIDATSDPPSPSLFVKSCIGSSDFWANKIRKANKGKDDGPSKKNIEFCDSLKALIQDLVVYTKEHHMSALAWNFNGGALEDYEATAASDDGASTAATTTKKRSAAAPPSAKMTIAEELAKKRSSAGNSAATNLKKVTKDQQTWRKEFKGETKSVVSGFGAVAAAPSSKSAPKSTATRPPVFEFQTRGSKWSIEHQTKSTTPNASGVLTVEIQNPKQNVYLYKCEGVTVDVKGKFNSVVVDACTKCAVVFDTVISSCEMVNCKKIQVQSRGLCSAFAIDKTDGVTIYLSRETLAKSDFITSKSSEMNVNYPDENDEMKEFPIPEQYRHKFANGTLVSEVSDLYH